MKGSRKTINSTSSTDTELNAGGVDSSTTADMGKQTRKTISTFSCISNALNDGIASGAISTFNVSLNDANVDSNTTPLGEKMNTASSFSCLYSLVHTILGSGMLGLPYALSRTGWVLGSLLLTTCACLSAFALHLLAMCALAEKGQSSCYTIAHSVMPKFTLLIDISVAIKCFGVATTHLIVIGDLMPDAMSFLGAGTFLSHRQFWVFVGFLVVFPLSFFRNLFSMKVISIFAISLVFVLTITIMMYAVDVPGFDACKDITENEECRGDTSNFVTTVDTARVLGILIFGFTCHQNIFAVKNEICDPTPRRIDGVILATIGIALTLYFMISLGGYSTFGNNCESDILKNYPDNYITTFIRIFVAILVVTSYPLQVHPARRSIMSLTSKISIIYSTYGKTSVDETLSAFKAYDDDDPDEVVSRASFHEKLKYHMITIFFTAFTLLLALFVHELDILLSLVGVTGSTIVSYILPGFLFYLKFKSKPNCKTYVACALGYLGLLIMPVALVFIFA